jgi:hypothetical protein
VATRDFVRSEIRGLLEEIAERDRAGEPADAERDRAR